MAKVVTINNWREINISAPVGRGGVNNRRDVLVIQALLKYALAGLHYFRNDKFSIPTGVMDPNTLKLIEKYQRYIRGNSGARVSVDGRIDPSNGTMYVHGKRLIWTISKLNGDAQTMHVLQNRPGAGHIEGLGETYPQVGAILSGSAVGSLDLGLE